MLINNYLNMSSDNFSAKRIACDTNKVHAMIEAAEEQWLDSLLYRISVPKIIVRKKKAGDMSNADWRDYLFNTFGLNIFKNLDTKTVKVFKYNVQREENTQVAEWLLPEVVYMKVGNSKKCELRLRYWQIL